MIYVRQFVIEVMAQTISVVFCSFLCLLRQIITHVYVSTFIV